MSDDPKFHFTSIKANRGFVFVGGVILGVVLTAIATDAWRRFVPFASGVPAQRSHVSAAPDGRTTIELRELAAFIDRNFAISVSRNGTTTEIYRSPDEGPPGTEQIVWSEDGRSFVLLSRNTSVLPAAKLPSGESFYLLYDLDSGILRCNTTKIANVERFNLGDLPPMRWGPTTMPSH